MSNKVWNLKYELGTTSRVAADSGNPQSRSSALAGARTIAEKNGWKVWVEHHITGVRIFDSVGCVPAKKCSQVVETKLKYTKITFAGGNWCVCKPGDVADMTEGSEGFACESIQMTEAEFNALPEFEAC
ncbi:hypothetical protein [Polaromonas sp.]|uniref:hypothetical protein n=1 Tax=Polaromonas sp. TaxID=1869339 RepID=UPI003529DDFC